MTEDAVNQKLSLLSTTTDYSKLADADLVIEAAFENMPLKKEIFTKLNSVCKPDAILASNTSYLSIDEIASSTDRPQNVVGLRKCF